MAVGGGGVHVQDAAQIFRGVTGSGIRIAAERTQNAFVPSRKGGGTKSRPSAA